MRTAPVLAVLVCHDGAEWLEDALAALRDLTVRPRRLVAVDTGSADSTPELLAGASYLFDAVLTLPRETGFGAAAAAAVEHGEQRWGDPGSWIWLLHDDCAPEPGCLEALLSVAELSPSAALLGPLCLHWDDPRLVVEAGLSTDAAGHRQTGVDGTELDLGQFGHNTEVLAVSSAGALVRRDVWTALGGYDPALPLLRDDLDFGWRANRANHVVLCVAAARLRHAGALAAGRREPHAVAGRRLTMDRAHGLRTYLVNCAGGAFVAGLPRLVVLGLLRAAGMLLLRRAGAARAEVGALGYLVSGRAGLLAARRARRATRVLPARGVRGLLTSRLTRMRNAVRGGLAGLIRRRVQADAALGRLPAEAAAPAANGSAPAAGPGSPSAGAVPSRRFGGLRRSASAVAVPIPGPAGQPTAPDRTRPSPRPRGGTAVADGTARARPALVMADVNPGRLFREVALAPAVLLVAAMAGLAVAVNRARMGLDLAGGRLLPPEGLAATWASYLAGWHPVGGGSAAPAPATLAVLGVIGAPVGSPAVAVSLLLLAAMPLAALSAYLATRAVPVTRRVRALVAAGYALVPVGTAAIAQGRLDVVVTYLLLPPVLAGTVAVLRGAPSGRTGGWLRAACGTALGLAAISAFAPVVHLLVLAVALVGFVLTPVPRSGILRRTAGLFTIVLLPLGLLLPWPAVVVQRPSVLVHGTGSVVPEQWPGWASLLALDPGGPGAASWVGVVLVLAALLAALLRPRRALLPGLGLVVLGVAAAAVLGSVPMMPLIGGASRPGFTGAPLLVATCGLLWIVLVACQADATASRPWPSRRVLAVAAGAAVVVLAAGAVLMGAAGPLRPASQDPAVAALAPSLAAELARDGMSVLVVGEEGEPTRLTRGRTARFGDDAIAPLRSTVARHERTAVALRTGQPEEVEAALADVAAIGVEFVVLPGQGPGAAAQQAGGLARAAPPTSDGRPVLRLARPSPGAQLFGPQLARQARSGASPPITAAVTAVPVPASPPTVAARVAPGANDRLLALAANDQPGWHATVDGATVPTVRAWGHQVAVEVPGTAVEVRVDRSESARIALLLGQAAVLLLAVATALPSRRSRADET
ncbi:MAG: glycosyltransferase [Pseudonocardiaceae bacterium]|nr:glycosyltransferase [Pseudonocardiaceae bacterium]